MLTYAIWKVRGLFVSWMEEEEARMTYADVYTLTYADVC
jgi:hypothetical protein